MKELLIITTALCAIASTGIFGLPASAQDARTAAAGDSILRIPACAFNEVQDGYNFTREHLLCVDSGSAGSFCAPVSLPHGSIIKKTRMVCWDANGSAYASLNLYRFDHTAPPAMTIADVNSSNNTGYEAFTDFVDTGCRYVNNHKYNYYLKVALGGGSIWIHHVVVVYTPPSS